MVTINAVPISKPNKNVVNLIVSKHKPKHHLLIYILSRKYKQLQVWKKITGSANKKLGQ